EEVTAGRAASDARVRTEGDRSAGQVAQDFHLGHLQRRTSDQGDLRGERGRRRHEDREGAVGAGRRQKEQGGSGDEEAQGFEVASARSLAGSPLAAWTVGHDSNRVAKLTRSESCLTG